MDFYFNISTVISYFNKANVVSWLLTCWYIITNKSNLIITTEMSVVFVYYAHKMVIVYTFCVWFVHIYICTGVKYLCNYCTKSTSNTPDILRNYSTYHGEKVFTVSVRMLDDPTGVLLYRSKHFQGRIRGGGPWGPDPLFFWERTPFFCRTPLLVSASIQKQSNTFSMTGPRPPYFLITF